MENKKVSFKIRRYKPGVIDPPTFQTFELDVSGDTTVLDALEQIRLDGDPGLMYRHGCHHASCGTCACVINGKERLACTTNIFELETNEIVVEPAKHGPVVGDLVLDILPFYKEFQEDWAILGPNKVDDRQKLEDCIECGICVSTCPVCGPDLPFVGPAVLAAINRQMALVPDQERSLLEIAGREDGQKLCERSIDCSRLCPSKVSPARHIAELRRKIEK